MTGLGVGMSLVLTGVFALASPVAGQIPESRCADCHIARADAPGGRHVSDWDRSSHERNGVGCDACHGGNPAASEPFQAHQGMLPFSNPASPVARINLPTTCGTCHAGALAAFRKSRHYELLRSGNREVPSCATCHEEAAAYLLSPKQLEGRCASCHGDGKVAPNRDLAPQARRLLEGIRDARRLLDDATSIIARVSDKERRAGLEAEARRAGEPLTQAAEAGHAFVFTGLEERLTLARRRIADLQDRLANPAAR